MQKSAMTARIVLFGLFAVLCSVFISVAHAETPSTGWIKNPNHTPIETRFVLTGQINKVDQTVAGFLEVRLAGDWKTYWRSPGEGGVAPSMTWGDSQNIRSIDWYWPYPKRFDLLGIETLGYKGSVIFPMTLHIDDLNKPVTFKADLTLSSCTTICVLTDYPFELTFTPTDLTLSKEAMHVYAQGLSQVPKESALISDVKAVWDATKMQLQVTATKKMGWIAPDVLVDGPSDEMQDDNFSRPKIDVDGDDITATFDVSSWMGTPNLTGENISVTLKDKAFIAEQPASIRDGMIASNMQSIVQMVLFALFGGFILNIMPCVFPVLGMKLSSVISAQGLEKNQIKLQFLASASGIVFSFWLLASFLVVLKLSGNAIGWGIQFQSAWFIGAMTLITVLFGANMLSLFEIRLSSNTNTWIASKGNNSYFGHFIQGMFATLLATPCSAPFLGTAVAFALATNIPTMYGIFTALALGMALPWILVAIFPSIALSLPKPGPWMSKVKSLFGVMMLITSIWLLNLLSNHLSELWIYAIAVIAGGAILLRTVQVHSKKAAGWLSILFAIAFGFGTVIDSMTSTDLLPAEPNWVPLSSESIQQHVDEGKVVFVDVTADWCVTCKANKIGVMLQEPVYSELNSANVVPMEGDWTVPNEEITSYLQDHGRFGVPFNVVYGPGAPNGIELPVILNEKAVMDAIKKAGGNSDG